MARARLVIHKNSFILSILSCSGTLQMMMGGILLNSAEWGAGILSLIFGVGLILGTSHAAAKIPALPVAKKTFMESLLAFFAGVLAVSGGLYLMMIGLLFWEEGLYVGIWGLLFVTLLLVLASAVFQYLNFRRWVRYLKSMDVIEDMQKSDIVCRDVYRVFPHRITLRFIRKHNPGAAEQIHSSCRKEKTTGTEKSEEDTPDKKEDFLPMTVPATRDIAFPEKNAGLRLRDLFVFYYGTDDIHVMCVLNLDYYFAFTGFYINDDTKIYPLEREQWSKLYDFELKKEDLPGDTAGWESLRTIEQWYSAKDIDDLIEAAVQKGMTLQKMCRYYPDCFLNYGAMQDIRIVRRIDGDQYFAVLPVSEKNMYSVKLRQLDQDEVNKIAENKITRYELLGKRSDWVSVEKCSRGIYGKEIKTFAADAENAGLTLREYLEKRAFPAWFEIMQRLYDTKQMSDFLKALESDEEITAAKKRKTLVVILLVIMAPSILCMLPAIAEEKSFILPFLSGILFAVAVPLLVYYLVEQRAFEKILKRWQTRGMTDGLENSYKACEAIYREYPRRITLRYIKKRNPQAAQKILSSLKKK